MAPEGWHILTAAEWGVLSNFLGGDEIAGKKMKSTSGWSENGNGDNSSGFSGLPGGGRGSGGHFYDIGGSGCWWINAEGDTDNAYRLSLSYYVDGLGSYSGFSRGEGLSVRCLRD